MSESILVLGEYRQTVTVLRSLGRAGFRVTLGCARSDSPSRYSRHVSATWLYDWSAPERFLAQLQSYIESRRPDFVFVVGESPLRRLITLGAFESHATWVNPEPATIARCFDKSALYELAPALGIPTPPWRRFTDPGHWSDEAREIGFPIVVKRNDSSSDVRGRKALIFATAAQFNAFLGTLSGEPDADQLLLQKYQPGCRHNCHVACADGRIIAFFQQKVLSTDELDDTGLGTAGISVAPSDELRSHCERLTMALRYTGIGCVQFMVDDATSSAGFLEFNARMDSTAALPYRLGYDYPLLAVELSRYRRSRRGPPAPITRPYAVGKTYHWLWGDLQAWIAAARAGRISRSALVAWALRMGRRALTSHHLTFAWDDPRPTLHMYWQHFGRRALRRLQLRSTTSSALGDD